MSYKKIKTILVYGKKKCIYMKPKGTREYVKSKGDFVLLSVYIKRVAKIAEKLCFHKTTIYREIKRLTKKLKFEKYDEEEKTNLIMMILIILIIVFFFINHPNK
jgi:dipeptide/tripeptide permease